MEIVVKEELKTYIDPLSADEYAALERSILAEGCRDALVLWGDVLIDGHNRYSICQRHGLPFQTIQNTRFESMEDVYLWMIDQHLGRRSVSDFQRGVLALRKREILQNRRGQASQVQSTVSLASPADVAETGMNTVESTSPWEGEGQASPTQADSPAQKSQAGDLNSREAIAKAARLSSSQVVLIERIQQQAAPEVVAALKAGEISLSAAATVATLPEEEQKAAAIAGKDELKQAAKRVREAKRKPRAASTENQHGDHQAELDALRQRVAELTQENEALKRQLARLQEA
ncbi:plasmid replication/partition related protein [Corticibacter populi]|uniref:Plasmid replication/partition related protein n=1 Tax=Corticibacter populi TaxID=1550736 RepID=A0A3M6QYT6_9BURK|nr:plasmid replication/partition related protein [Corticibacter populi]RMX08180.1 plasmid replication/partition related protein [Corticibacter populi]RZS35445.1 hypothetical protein EV687_0512 [Corticibacter populi]